MASKVKVAIVLILLTLVPTAKATADNKVMLDVPAFDTLNAAPVWTSRYLWSTDSTTDEGNGEERAIPPEMAAEVGWVKGHVKLTVPLAMTESETVLPKTESEVVNALKEESEKVKVPKEKSKDKLSVYDAIRKWWASAVNYILRKDNEVKLLVKNVNDIDDVSSITKILEEKHFQRWFNMRRSAEDIHNLLGLPKGPALLESLLVWIWLDYTIWIGRMSKNSMDTISVFEKMFGSSIMVAKMFKNVKRVKNFAMYNHVARLRKQFLSDWLMREHEWQQLRLDLEKAGFTEMKILYFEQIHKQYHAVPKAPEGHGRV
ncbi:unnamed protein product [Peronospora destructor]|uniref:RxLR effector protein n=1 Tax=Peronospora destructor TaxID=86335 RepID=A0AAV0TLY3_9STRA|nr:unnamed protein product [Peronospora destructor]